MPFVAGSRRLLPALLSTKPLPAGSVGLLIVLLPVDLFFCQQEGSCFCLCVAGKSSWDDIAEGLSEGGDDVLVKFNGWDRSADCDLGRGIWYGAAVFFQVMFLLGGESIYLMERL